MYSVWFLAQGLKSQVSVWITWSTTYCKISTTPRYPIETIPRIRRFDVMNMEESQQLKLENVNNERSWVKPQVPFGKRGVFVPVYVIRSGNLESALVRIHLFTAQVCVFQCEIYHVVLCKTLGVSMLSSRSGFSMYYQRQFWGKSTTDPM